jgi:hypothetical protein
VLASGNTRGESNQGSVNRWIPWMILSGTMAGDGWVVGKSVGRFSVRGLAVGVRRGLRDCTAEMASRDSFSDAILS